MLRWLDHLLLTFLMLTSTALIVLWCRSHSIGDRYRWVQIMHLEEGGVVIESKTWQLSEGGFSFLALRSSTHDADAAQRMLLRTRADPPGYSTHTDPRYPIRMGSSGDSLLGVLGVNWTRETRRGFTTQREWFVFVIPLWLPLAVVMIYPMTRFVIGVVRRERQERIMLGLCPRCGMNVRDGPSRCPACGKRAPLLAPDLAGAAR